MKNDLTVQPSEYGIEETKAVELVGNLPQIQEERKALELQYEDVIKMDIESPLTSQQARELRLKIRDNRTKGIEVWHKTTKDYFLKGGQFVDAIKRKEIAVNQRMEENLEQIEKYFEIKEAKRKAELSDKRISEINIYSEFVPMGIDFGSISEDEYLKVFNGAKLQYDAKIEAEKKAELERLEAERKAEMERVAEQEKLKAEAEKQRVENERLKAEAEAREKQLAEERAKAEKERKALEEKAKAEAEAREKAEAEILAKKQEEECIAKERQEAELKAKKEAEKLAKAPIKKKMQVWINSFEIPNIDESNASIEEIKTKFEAFKKWSLSQADLF